MTDQLFRQEAIDHQRHKLAGDVIVSNPVNYLVLTSVMVIILITGIIFLLLGNYTRKETASGQLTLNAGVVRLISPDYLTVESVHVVDDELVREGEPIVTLIQDKGLSGGGNAGELFLNELEQEISEKQVRLSLLDEQFRTDRLKREADIASAAAMRHQIDRQIRVLRQRILLHDGQYQNFMALHAEGAASKTELDGAFETLLLAKQNLEEIRAQRLSVVQDFESLTNQQSRAEIDEASARSLLRESLAALRQRRAEAESQFRFVIRAPVAGKITTLLARTGQTVVPGQLQAAILPRNSELIAEIYTPTRAAGFIAPGQEVRLLYDAFPYQQFGAGGGYVISVSKTILPPTEGPASLGIEEPVYKVTIALNDQSVQAFGKAFPLQVGMTLNADLLLEKRSLAELIFEPILAGSRM